MNTPLAKITATQNVVALSYHRVRGLYFLAVIFAATIVLIIALIKITSNILLINSTAAQNGVALSYHKVSGLYFLAVVFVRIIISALHCYIKES